MKFSSRSREIKDLHEQTGQWVDLAQSNSQAAKVLVKNGLKIQGIFIVQQSMEAATKAFAVANGKDHSEVRSQGHQNLKLLMMTLDTVVKRWGKSDYVNHMVGGHYFKVDDYDVGKHLARAVEVTSDEKRTNTEKRREANRLYESAITLTPKEVKRLLWLFDQSHSVLNGMSGLLGHLKSREMSLELPLPRGRSNSTLTQQIIEQCRLPDREFHATEVEVFCELEELISGIIVDGGGGHTTLHGRHLTAQFKRFMQLQTALLGTLIIGSIVWPHEVGPRYPAPPDAPRKVSEAAERFHGHRRVGIQHYTDQLGVVKHLKAIVERSTRITTYLRSIQDNYYILDGPTAEHH